MDLYESGVSTLRGELNFKGGIVLIEGWTISCSDTP